jgi:hypothetical protein
MKMIVDIDVEQERREGVRRIFFVIGIYRY